MITMRGVALFLVPLLLLGTPVLAGETPADKVSYLQVNPESDPGRDSAGRDREDRQLAMLQADFERFARIKVEEMNRNHKLSRARMQISRQKDGSYGAVFHQIDSSSLSCQVRRSQSKTVPYVAVLAYQEQVLAASGSTPEECRKGRFAAVGVIPNRHIFSYNKGAWK